MNDTVKTMNLDGSLDFVDQDPRYMDILVSNKQGEIFFNNWTNWVDKHFQNVILTYNVPFGKVVQAGTWRGAVYFKLQEIFGKDRCIGFDIEKYIDDDTIIYGDFRKISNNYVYECALFYNALGSWKYNFTSKQSGLDYAIKNLVPGGLYIDNENFEFLIENKNFDQYKIYDKRMIVMRKANV